MSADGEQGGVIQADRDAAADLIEAYWPNNPDMQLLAQRYRDGHTQGVWAHAFMRHRITHAAPTTDTQEVVRKAVNLAYDLLMEVEQTTGNVWWVNVDDPEVAVSDTLDALEDARAALAKHPTSPEDAA